MYCLVGGSTWLIVLSYVALIFELVLKMLIENLQEEFKGEPKVFDPHYFHHDWTTISVYHVKCYHFPTPTNGTN